MAPLWQGWVCSVRIEVGMRIEVEGNYDELKS